VVNADGKLPEKESHKANNKATVSFTAVKTMKTRSGPAIESCRCPAVALGVRFENKSKKRQPPTKTGREGICQGFS
jgi:methylthioribose-1-phosphate isomerase